MCMCELLKTTTTLTQSDADTKQRLAVVVDNHLELAHNYLDRNKCIKPLLRFSLQQLTPQKEDTPPTETTAGPEDAPPNTPPTRNTPRTEDAPPNTPPTGNTPGPEDTLPTGNTPRTEDTPPTENTFRTNDTPPRNITPPTEDAIKDILNCNFDDYNTKALITSNYNKWSKDPSSFYKQSTSGTHLQTEDPQCRLVHIILQLGVSDAHSYALRRICSIVLRRIRASYPRNRSPNDIARSMYGDSYDPKCIARITAVMLAGPNYDAIGQRQGYGILLFLGTEIPLHIWETKLPLSGQLFDKAMDHLHQTGVVKQAKLYDGLVSRIIESLQRCIPKPELKFVGGTKRACLSVSKPKPKRTRLSAGSASKPKSRRTRPPTCSSLKPVTEHQRDVTRNCNQRDASENGNALQYQGTSASNEPYSTEAPLGAERIAMHNLVSSYPPPDGSSNKGVVNPGLFSSILSTDSLQFIENRKMNQAKAVCDTISAGNDSNGYGTHGFRSLLRAAELHTIGYHPSVGSSSVMDPTLQPNFISRIPYANPALRLLHENQNINEMGNARLSPNQSNPAPEYSEASFNVGRNYDSGFDALTADISAWYDPVDDALNADISAWYDPLDDALNADISAWYHPLNQSLPVDVASYSHPIPI